MNIIPDSQSDISNGIAVAIRGATLVFPAIIRPTSGFVFHSLHDQRSVAGNQHVIRFVADAWRHVFVVSAEPLETNWSEIVGEGGTLELKTLLFLGVNGEFDMGIVNEFGFHCNDQKRVGK